MIIKSEVIHTTCPFCNNSFNVNHNYTALNRDKDYGYAYVRQIACLNCERKFIIYENHRDIEESEINELSIDVLNFFELSKSDLYDYFAANPGETRRRAKKEFFIRPLCPAKSAPIEVNNPEITRDYNEAAMILEISPRASAALSRNCIKKILQKKAPLLNPENLSLMELISCVIDTGALPRELTALLHYVLEISSFSSNPIKNEYPNSIVDVDKEEAELNLNVLQRLFDIYYVHPAKTNAIKEELEERMKSLGKKIL